MRSKKLLQAGLAAVLAVSLLAGCAGGSGAPDTTTTAAGAADTTTAKEEKTETPEEIVTLKWYMSCLLYTSRCV